MVNKARLVELFMKMAEISSLSWQERTFCNFLKSEFGSRGFSAEEDDAGRSINGNAGNLLVRIPGTVDVPALMLVAHMDTVVPGTDIKPVIDGEIIKSQGETILGSDDKAGIAAIIEACDVLAEQKLARPPLEILLTVGEEQGLLGAKHFDFSKVTSRLAYTLDSGDPPGTIVVQSPCQNEIEYTVTGRAAHAGINPQDGLNAIQIMARALAQMPCGRIDAETTCNLGIIEGGRARNIVAEQCRVKGEARSLQRAKLDKLTAELVDIFKREVRNHGGQPETEVKFLYPEFSLDPEEKVVQLAARAASAIGLSPCLESTGGGSDASIINGNGIRCANLGIGMSSVHTTAEFIKIEDLVNDARWILEIIRQAAVEA